MWLQRGGVAGFARYHESPVGPYTEVFAARLDARRLGLHVPFMAVDSEPSLRGGRRHWALPKTMAAFAREPRGFAATAEDGGWSARASVVSAGVRVPLAVAVGLVQEPGARTPARARGWGRLARIRVEADGAPLMPGVHVGVVVERATLVVRDARRG